VPISTTIEFLDLLRQKGPHRLPKEIELLNKAIHLYLSSSGLFLVSFYTKFRGKPKGHEKVNSGRME
jgi:NADH:ubiquinone oxidoreductase subunit E